MARYLFRITYTLADGSVTYEPACVDAATEADARTEIGTATARYAAAVGATKTLTLVTTV